ncbi:hypothetical protein L9F63_005821 [Diploptera punctata]|uniref:tRNA-splicing endonuclease subunit Sen54 N-terminal domain-containing protein n=1 Tax=Diploptera punctata TaxID=6984 RepID=A0AAD8E5L1_DIPPU|nr:hypothetical protein L9F63_005821 [Diploptera punctata]
MRAQELVQLRVKVDKTLPTKGTKEFKPSHSWLENKQIQTALDERKALLEEERIEKLGSLAKAEWDAENKVAIVTFKVGRHWKQMGHDVGGKLVLFPEEALFLLEANSLELTYNGVAMNIQQAYCALLGPASGCTLNEYLTYLHLLRQGYIVFRHSKSIRATRYERQIRLDQHSVGQKQCKSKDTVLLQEIVIDDGNTDIKSPIQSVSNSSKTGNDIKPSEDMNTARINGESNKNIKQIHLAGRSCVNSVNNEQSNYNSNCSNASNENSEAQQQKGVFKLESNQVTVIHCVKKARPEVLPSDNNESERTNDNNKGTDALLPNKLRDFGSVVSNGTSSNQGSVNDKKVISSNEETDVIIVDDSSTSMDTSEKQKSGIENELETENIGQLEKNKEPNILQGEKHKVNVKGADVVDISDSSQTSQQDLVEKTNSSKNEIEIVTLIDDKKDVDEIVEVKCNTSIKSNFLEKSRGKFSQTNLESEVHNSSQRNSILLKNEGTHAVKNNIGQNKRKITNVQLKNDEIEIMSNVIDLSEDEEKLSVKDEIQLVDLDDDEVITSWEKERMKILDSIPNIEGKYVMHVKVPDRSLLPPNVCPQKEDYYIHRWNINEAGLGGRPSAETSLANSQNNSLGTITPSPWSPWVQFPSCQQGGGGNMFGAAEMWNNNNVFPFLNPFMNPQFQSSFFGAFGMQGMFPNISGMFQNFAGPSWRSSNPPTPFVPHHSRGTFASRPWHYQRRPYYRRPYYKRKRRYTQYNNSSVGLGDQNYRYNSDPNDVIPLKVDDEKSSVKVQIIDDDNDDDENYDIDIDDNENDNCKEEESEEEEDDDVIECTSDTSPFKIENDIIECTDKPNRNGVDRGYKRKGSQNQRNLEPPQKLRGIIDKLKVELKQGKSKTWSQDDKGKENAADAKTWKDVKQIVILDSSSEEEDDTDDDEDKDDDDDDDDDIDEEDVDDEDDSDDEIFVIVDDFHKTNRKRSEPLIQPENCKDIDSILSKLQIIKSATFENRKETAPDKNLKISFDLYMPSTTFRKASPGLPNYRIIVFGHEEPIPEPGDMVRLMRDFQDDVPLLFAIVLPDAVTFLQCGSVQLPVETFCP